MVARLEDGEFFWREDQKLKIEDLVAKLANVTFHEKIGSLSEHMARAGVIAASLAEQAGLTAEERAAVARAAEIYKLLRLRQLSVSTTFLIQQTELFQRLRLVPSLRLQINWILSFPSSQLA